MLLMMMMMMYEMVTQMSNYKPRKSHTTHLHQRSIGSSNIGMQQGLHLLFLTLLFQPLLPFIYTATNAANSEVSSHYWESPYSQPYFDNSSRREVTSIVGQAALLQCRVRNLGDRAVSWIRKRDLHILTVGILTYTNDQRFQSLHTEGSDEWTLRISSPQPRDSGTYECQVSTEPKISQGFRLNVVVSRARILGNPELFIKSGSDINLTCLAMLSPIPPSFIYWYKGKRLLNYSQRSGINVITERTTRTSKLLISRAITADSGNYTCAPSSSDSASVVVHVINGEHPAAMQHGNNSASSPGFGDFRKTLRRFGLNGLLTLSTVSTLYHFVNVQCHYYRYYYRHHHHHHHYHYHHHNDQHRHLHHLPDIQDDHHQARSRFLIGLLLHCSKTIWRWIVRRLSSPIHTPRTMLQDIR